MSIKIIAPNDPALEALQKAIEKENLNLNLKIIPWAEYHPTLMKTLESEQSSYQAVFIPGHIWLPNLAQNGDISNLSKLFKNIDENLLKEYDFEDIMPIIQKESSFRGDLFELPFFSDGHIIYIKDEKSLHVKDKEVPILSCKEIKDMAFLNHNPPKEYGISLKADKSEIFTDFLPYLWEFKGEIFDEKENPVLNHPNNIKALEFYCSLKKFAPPKTDSYKNEEIAKSIEQGESCIITTWGGQSAPLFIDGKNSRYKAASFSKPWNATWGVAIPSNQPEKIKLQTLETLLKLLGKSTDQLVTKIAGSPVRKSSYTKEEFEKYPWLQAQYEMLKRAKPLPSIPKLGDFLGLLYELTHKAFVGELTPKQALEQAQKEALGSTN